MIVAAGSTLLSGCGPTGTSGSMGGGALGTLEQAMVCATGPTVKGVDVSIYQGTIDWHAVADAGYVFGFARVSDGLGTDSTFSTNWSGMANAGIARGAYQFFEPGDDPTAQANIVIQAVGMLGPRDLPVVADMEVTGGQSAATIISHLQTWVSAVQAGTGRSPAIYTALGFWDASVNSTAFGELPLWAANWGVTCPNLATGWSNWEFWQYSDTGSVKGIPATVDLDEFNGSLDQLLQLDGGATYGAQFVSQTWPFATTVISMTPGQVLPAKLVLKNTGTAPWNSMTRLGTTQPRDRVSAFSGTDWIAADRPAAVTGTVAPGATFEFDFSFHAPLQPGDYDEFFGVVQDGAVWFSDPGQDGPADNQLEAKFEVVAAGDAGSPDAGSHTDAGMPTPDAGQMNNPDAGSGTSDSGQPEDDAGMPDNDAGQTMSGDDGGMMEMSDGGTGTSGVGACGCGSSSGLSFAAALLMLLAGRRRRAHDV